MKYFKDALKESESLNVVDETGEYLTTDSGHIVTVARGVAHKLGIFHQTANILAVLASVPEPKVVLQKRALDKDIFPGALTVSCGGHMGTAIDARKAVIREAHEELNLSVAPERLTQIGSANGHRNLLREWRHRGLTIVQMGRSGDVVTAPITTETSVIDYIRSLSLDSRPGKDAPDGLQLANFNQEFCFYFLYVLSRQEVAGIRFTDGEVGGLKQVALSEFISGKKETMTDSTFTLLDGILNLAQLIRNECQKPRESA